MQNGKEKKGGKYMEGSGRKVGRKATSKGVLNADLPSQSRPPDI